jgi:hypothetical protein
MKLGMLIIDSKEPEHSSLSVKFFSTQVITSKKNTDDLHISWIHIFMVIHVSQIAATYMYLYYAVTE